MEDQTEWSDATIDLTDGTKKYVRVVASGRELHILIQRLDVYGSVLSTETKTLPASAGFRATVQGDDLVVELERGVPAFLMPYVPRRVLRF